MPHIAGFCAQFAKVGWPFRAHSTIIDMNVMTDFPECPISKKLSVEICAELTILTRGETAKMNVRVFRRGLRSSNRRIWGKVKCGLGEIWVDEYREKMEIIIFNILNFM